MKTHYTSADKLTSRSLAACDYTGPKPRWKMSNKFEDTTCTRCRRIMGMDAKVEETSNIEDANEVVTFYLPDYPKVFKMNRR